MSYIRQQSTIVISCTYCGHQLHACVTVLTVTCMFTLLVYISQTCTSVKKNPVSIGSGLGRGVKKILDYDLGQDEWEQHSRL